MISARNNAGIMMGQRFLDRFGKLGGDILWIGLGALVILGMLAVVLPRA